MALLERTTPKMQGAEEKTSLAQTLQEAAKICQECHPITPMMCITQCNIWKLKNEFRKYREKMSKVDYLQNLLNTLKNKRRLQILQILSKRPSSLVRIQQDLKNLGSYHGQETLAKEYVTPLIETCLVKMDSNLYQTTIFGCKVNSLMKDFQNIEKILQPHSKCYEENVLRMLLNSPRTYDELKFLVPIESLKRVLTRLLKTKLIAKSAENNYIFYFKTKRNPEKERLSPTARRVHNNIPEEGITAEKLAEKTNISLRRTYKYIRKLRGKKLVFKRKCPKTYALTKEGTQIAMLLEKIYLLFAEFKQASEVVTRFSEAAQISALDTTKHRKVAPLQVLKKSEFSHKVY